MITHTLSDTRRLMLALGCGAALSALGACATTPAETPDAPTSEPVAEAPAAPAEIIVEGVPVTCAGADQAEVAPPFEGLATIAPVTAFIKSHEGLKLEAYQGPSGKTLIGYGHGGPDVTLGMTITQAQAEAYFADDLNAHADAVKAAVTTPMTANEFSAFVDFTFNLGEGNFRRSTLLRKFNAGDRAGAADEFLRWNKVGGQPNAGLTARRAVERAIFLCRGEVAVLKDAPQEAGAAGL